MNSNGQAVCLVDTNVLLRIVSQQDPLHGVAAQAFRNLRDRYQFTTAAQNAVEFWNVVTRPAEKNGFGLSVDQANTQLRFLERLFEPLPESPASYREWRRLVVQFKVAGVQVHDARLVAVMRTAGIMNILTFNIRDFQRYSPLGIVAIDPHSAG